MGKQDTTKQEKKPLKPYTFTVQAIAYSTDPRRARKLVVWALWSAGVRCEFAELQPEASSPGSET